MENESQTCKSKYFFTNIYLKEVCIHKNIITMYESAIVQFAFKLPTNLADIKRLSHLFKKVDF